MALERQRGLRRKLFEWICNGGHASTHIPPWFPRHVPAVLTHKK